MDAKVLRFLGTAFVLLRGQSMAENAFADNSKAKSTGKQSSPSAIRVLLADDSEVVRRAISRILNDAPEIELVGETCSLGQTLKLASQLQPEVIVMDLHMGNESDVTPTQVKSALARSQLVTICIWTDLEAKNLAESFGAVVLLNKANLAADLIPTIKQHAQR